MRARVHYDLAIKVVEEVSNRVRSSASTREIYRIVVNTLLKEDVTAANRYRLKESIMLLGPQGYPFEEYFAQLLKMYGYHVETNQLIRGECVVHEVDIVAVKDGVRYMVECKYHNSPGIYVDLKTALYVYARFLDLKKKFDKAWLATNTKFTKEALKYSNCVGVKLTGWRYPREGGLEKMVEEKKLYPVTALFSLNDYAIRKLLEAGVVLAKDLTLLEPEDLHNLTSIPLDRAVAAIEEAKRLAR
ncbi:MAG: ATPase [Thermoprotei archaeon]|nr:MAG: ATPase [Thermoprotei archaeon]